MSTSVSCWRSRTAVDHLLETMPDASVPATPMRGSEQVVFRLHLDANPDDQAREGQVFLVLSSSCEVVPGSHV